MPWPNLSSYLQTHLLLLSIPLPLILHFRKTLESIHILCSKITIDQKHRYLHRPSREKALVEGFDSLLRKCAALLRAVNEMPGDVDKRGRLKDARVRKFGEVCEEVVELVEGMEEVRIKWLEVLRRGQGGELREAREVKGKVAEGEVGRYALEQVGSEDEGIDEGSRNAEKRKSTREDDLWAAQSKYEGEIVRLAEEAKSAIWRLLTGEELANAVVEKHDGEGEEGKTGSGGTARKIGVDDSGFFEHIDKFIEKNMDDMDPKLKRYSRY